MIDRGIDYSHVISENENTYLPLSSYKRLWNKYNIMALIIQIVMFVSLMIFCHVYSLHVQPASVIVNVSLDCLAIAVLTFMFQSSIQIRTPDEATVMFMMLVLVDTFYLYLDGVAWLVNNIPYLRVANITINTLYYICSIVIVFLFWYFICALIGAKKRSYKKSTVLICVITIIALLLIVGNVIWEYYFSVSVGGTYSRNDTYYISTVCPVLILLICTAFILMQRVKYTEKIILLSYMLFPLVGAVLTVNSKGPSLTCILTFLSLFFIYSNLYMKREREIAKGQADLAKSEINSMLLQINPHFIYNTLGSVAGLCHDEPEKAEEMLFSFSNYLRNNFGEMAHKTLVPFEKEIEHLKSYIDIEKMRFPDINVITDFRVVNFELPSLSLQPLVENAITHGIMGREKGGTIKISTCEDSEYYYVIVEDDGVGFDTNKPLNDGRNHIGVSNVRKRLKILCDGILIINSTPDIGTISEIRIPKEAN